MRADVLALEDSRQHEPSFLPKRTERLTLLVVTLSSAIFDCASEAASMLSSARSRITLVELPVR